MPQGLGQLQSTPEKSSSPPQRRRRTRGEGTKKSRRQWSPRWPRPPPSLPPRLLSVCLPRDLQAERASTGCRLSGPLEAARPRGRDGVLEQPRGRSSTALRTLFEVPSPCWLLPTRRSIPHRGRPWLTRWRPFRAGEKRKCGVAAVTCFKGLPPGQTSTESFSDHGQITVNETNWQAARRLQPRGWNEATTNEEGTAAKKGGFHFRL